MAVARAWLDRISEEVEDMNTVDSIQNSRRMLTLKEDKTINWTLDKNWEKMMELETVLKEREGKFGISRI